MTVVQLSGPQKRKHDFMSLFLSETLSDRYSETPEESIIINHKTDKRYSLWELIGQCIEQHCDAKPHPELATAGCYLGNLRLRKARYALTHLAVISILVPPFYPLFLQSTARPIPSADDSNIFSSPQTVFWVSKRGGKVVQRGEGGSDGRGEGNDIGEWIGREVDR